MKLYAVFGNPIAHSKSPLLHNFVFSELKIPARYVRFLLESPNPRDFRELFFECGFSGGNITVPFKELLMESCDEIAPLAQKIGAINTIVRRGKRLCGYNTDAPGFYKCIERYAPKSALIIGAGGSARAVAFALREHKIEPFILNRSAERLKFFAQNGFECADFSQARDLAHKKFDLVINATASSINDALPLDCEILGELLKRAKFALDLMYGKSCPFLELAKKQQIRAIDGAKMLFYQAVEASSLFLDKPSSKIERVMAKAERFSLV